jgi:transcription antitermination protein NusB
VKNGGRARGWALQALYAWESRGGEPSAAVGVLQDLFANLRVSPRNRPFAEVLVRLVASNLTRIDGAVEGALTNWRLDRLSAIDRNVLRLGTAELLFVDEVPPRVTIREMVQLAEKFGTDDSPRFVNGVLDAVMRREAPDEARRAP